MAVGCVRPNLDDVLAAVVPGRVEPLNLTAEQKRSFRDREGQLALHLLRHALGARAASPTPPPDDFPLQPLFLQSVARALGVNVGVKRCYMMRRRLLDAQVLTHVGSYRPAYRNRAGAGTYRVPLFALAARVAAEIRRRACGAPHLLASSRQRRRVKTRETRRWWQHPLFGTLDGLPPPEMRGQSKQAKRMRMWRSADEMGAAR